MAADGGPRGGERKDGVPHRVQLGEAARRLPSTANMGADKCVFHTERRFTVGVQISDKCDPDELIELIETVNPTNQPGKIMIIVRMGAEKLRENLPKLIAAVENAGACSVRLLLALPLPP